MTKTRLSFLNEHQPWSGSRPKKEFLRPKRMLKARPADVVLLGHETCIRFRWQLVGTKSMQPRMWGLLLACLNMGEPLFCSSSANWEWDKWNKWLGCKLLITSERKNKEIIWVVTHLLVSADTFAYTLQFGVADISELILWHRYDTLALSDQLTAARHKMVVVFRKGFQYLKQDK